MSSKSNISKSIRYGDYHIRRASLSDLDAIFEIEQTCSGTPWQIESLRQDLSGDNNAFYWVAALEASSGIAAYGACWHMVDQAEIMNVAVLPEWRRKGIAGQILHAMERHAHQNGLQSLILEVRERNEPARQLYRRNGFSEIACRHHYYPDNRENAIIMSKKISETYD